jgi:hypothetical protein
MSLSVGGCIGDVKSRGESKGDCGGGNWSERKESDPPRCALDFAPSSSLGRPTTDQERGLVVRNRTKQHNVFTRARLHPYANGANLTLIGIVRGETMLDGIAAESFVRGSDCQLQKEHGNDDLHEQFRCCICWESLHSLHAATGELRLLVSYSCGHQLHRQRGCWGGHEDALQMCPMCRVGKAPPRSNLYCHLTREQVSSLLSCHCSSTSRLRRAALGSAVMFPCPVFAASAASSSSKESAGADMNLYSLALTVAEHLSLSIERIQSIVIGHRTFAVSRGDGLLLVHSVLSSGDAFGVILSE